MSFAKPLWLLLAIAISPQLVNANETRLTGSSRLATFQNAGNHYFALSVMPDQDADYPRPEAYEVVVVFDTSATQTGVVRIEGLEVLDELAATLPAGARLSLLACDVDTVILSDGLVAGSDPKWDTARARLQQRIPLGATDLGTAFRTAIKQFSPAPAQRTIVYIGDGVNRAHFLTSEEHRQLVSDLVEARVTVSALAIGPLVDVPTLAAFANQTGGIVLSREAIRESTQAIGRTLGLSTALPVLWVEQAKLPTAISSHFPQQFPPLRIDRDTVVVGKLGGEAIADPMDLQVTSAAQSLKLRVDVAPKQAIPTWAFWPPWLTRPLETAASLCLLWVPTDCGP